MVNKDEVVLAVEKINAELYKKYEKNSKDYVNWWDYIPILSYTIANQYVLVSISIPSKYDSIEINLYNSTNNDLIYYELSDKYETMYSHIKRKFRELKKELNNIKL